jgi:GNAT superfamily N-acetyltransferase
LIEQWDWKYVANPFNLESDPYVLLLRQGDSIIGMLGGLTLRASIRGDECSVGIACDLMIHPAHRGRRLFSKLMERYIQDRPFGIGWANSVSNHVWVTSATASARNVPLIAFSIFSGYGLARRKIDSSSADEIRIIQIERFDSRFDDLWSSVRGDYPIALIRDQRYLDWRFDDRPDAKYTRFCAIRGNDLLGYLILRVAENDGARRAYLVDWMVKGRSLAVFSPLVRHAIAHARREGALLISTRTTTPIFRRMLNRMGFVPWFWGPREYAITRAPLQAESFQAFRDMSQWFSTMGDGDLEMSL